MSERRNMSPESEKKNYELPPQGSSNDSQGVSGKKGTSAIDVSNPREHARMLIEAGQKKIAEAELDTIDMGEFSKMLPPAEIQKDALYVRDRKEDFKKSNERDPVALKEAKLLAQIFEGLLTEQIELNEWFGDAVTAKTSDYDDYYNGIDTVLTYRASKDGLENAQNFGLSIDFTISNNLDVTAEKIRKILSKARTGKLGTVKYFRTADREDYTINKQVPQVVITLSKETVLNLVESWVHGKQSELAKHPAQILLLEQMRSQLVLQASDSKIPFKIKREIVRCLPKISEILEKKKREIDSKRKSEFWNDKLHLRIMELVKDISERGGK